MGAAGAGWWRSAVVYQVYPRSFADHNGDGVGDLAGVTSRLEHIADLGADALWLTPFQRSPQADHGYDVSDYCDVDPLFGSLDDFDALIEAAHDRALRVIVDLVPNHCSSEHPAFQAALAAGPGSPERERFHFSPGRGEDGDLPPNNWPSVFGGPAWTRVTEADGRPGEWYLHLYAPEQPDWNWRHPATAELMDDALRFWLDRGADGVRIDVAHGLFKADGLPDHDEPDAIEPMRLRGNPLACDQEEVHEVYRRWRRVCEEYSPERVLVGEVNLVPERAARYVRPDELHQAFAFAFLAAPWDAPAWCEAATGLLDAATRTGSPVTWVVENHDVVRSPTRYGGGHRGAAREGGPAGGARPARLGVPLPGSGARPAGGRRPRRSPPGPRLAALGRHPRRRPGAAALERGSGRCPRLLVVGRRAPVAARTAGRLGSPVGRRTDRPRRVDARAVPSGPGAAAPAPRRGPAHAGRRDDGGGEGRRAAGRRPWRAAAGGQPRRAAGAAPGR